jgi:hypothetical protein
MTRANVLVHEAIATLTARGFIPSVSGKKHVKIRWSDRGRSYVLVVSRSPSNHRARANSRALLRRLLRANGGAP